MILHYVIFGIFVIRCSSNVLYPHSTHELIKLELLDVIIYTEIF